MKEVFAGIFVFIVGIVLLWAGIFYVNKKNYKEPDDGMNYLLKLTPLPKIINYWLAKFIFLLAGFLLVFSCIYGVIQNI